jgi:hypothetical protein
MSTTSLFIMVNTLENSVAPGDFENNAVIILLKKPNLQVQMIWSKVLWSSL